MHTRERKENEDTEIQEKHLSRIKEYWVGQPIILGEVREKRKTFYNPILLMKLVQ